MLNKENNEDFNFPMNAKLSKFPASLHFKKAKRRNLHVPEKSGIHAFFFQTSDKRPRTTTVSLGCTMFLIAHASASTITLFRFASITTITLSPDDGNVDFGSNPAILFP